MTGNSSTGLLPASRPLDPAVPAMLDPRPLIQSGRNWTRWAGPLVSVLILVVALHQFRGIDPASLWGLVPGGIGFWAAFALYYLAGPLSEWVIFRRLWSIPADGFAALLRKLVSNEILLGYLGRSISTPGPGAMRRSPPPPSARSRM